MRGKNSGFILLRALGDETRYKLASALLEGERCACELPKLVGRAQPTVSLQLKHLLNAGVVSSRRDGKKILYRLSGTRARKILRQSVVA